MINCLNCSTETSNPKFCCRSCSATFTNKASPKRKRKSVCAREGCSEITRDYRTSLCIEHFNEYKEGKYRGRTIGEYRERLSVVGKHPSWINSHIRLFARSWLKHLTVSPCLRCGYDKHVELAHIKAVSEFRDDELLMTVNSEDNVIPLCPTCHWEFDNLPRDGFFLSQE